MKGNVPFIAGCGQLKNIEMKIKLIIVLYNA